MFAAFSSVANAQEDVRQLATRNDFKVTMLSLGSGSSRFTYERAFSPKNSAEITFGLVGLGWDWINHSSPKGQLVKAAYKWLLAPQRRCDSWLAGLYIKPELVAALFRYTKEAVENTTRQIALMAEWGYQFIAGRFLLDVYMGLGPSLGTGNDNNYYHSFIILPRDGWLAFTSGYRVGFAF